MKLNSTIGLTLILLASMLIAGVVSAVAGMTMGREALKGITQPDTRPTNNNIANRKGNPNSKEALSILSEDKILASVKVRTQGEKAPAEAKPAAPAEKAAAPQAKLPVIGESKGVTMEVKSMQQQGDTLVIAVSLKNAADYPVKFLYSFLEVKDEQGRTLSANAEGLPSELPADNQAYAGTVRIPTASVEKVEKVSMTLSDYPNQQVHLELSEIPVIR